MISLTTQDADHRAARLHGRRSRMAEGLRLQSLSMLNSLPALGLQILPGTGLSTATAIQHRLTQQLVTEMGSLLQPLKGAAALVLQWMLQRFALAHLKLLVRALHAHEPPALITPLLLDLPGLIRLDPALLMKSGNPVELARQLPASPWGNWLHSALATAPPPSPLFFLEAALDRNYFKEGLHLATLLPSGIRSLVVPLIRQEADLFQLMLVIRGRFHFDLPPAAFTPYHVEGTEITPARYHAMAKATDMAATSTLALRHALDTMPSAMDAGAIESCGWRRYVRLANRAFRRGHPGFAMTAGYIGIRRMETANLITLSEGIRTGLADDRIRMRMIPPFPQEAAHA